MSIRNPYVKPMNERNRSVQFADRREARGGSKNDMLELLLEYEDFMEDKLEDQLD